MDFTMNMGERDQFLDFFVRETKARGIAPASFPHFVPLI